MRLCDRDIEAWLDNGQLDISPAPGRTYQRRYCRCAVGQSVQNFSWSYGGVYRLERSEG